MSAIDFPQVQALRSLLTDNASLDCIVDVFYDKLLQDYRVNRFFGPRPQQEQSTALKAYLHALFAAGSHDSEQTQQYLDNFFQAAFARSNFKPSLVTGNDFMFLLDIVGGETPQPLTPLCESHSWLLKLLPDDDHYDVAMEHLTATLKEQGLAEDMAYQLLALAEKGRDGVLGRGGEIKKAA